MQCVAVLCVAVLCGGEGEGEGKEGGTGKGRRGEARRVGRGVGFLLGLGISPQRRAGGPGPARLDLTVTVVLHCIPPTNPLQEFFSVRFQAHLRRAFICLVDSAGSHPRFFLDREACTPRVHTLESNTLVEYYA